MKTKILLPMLAFICAIGMAFSMVDVDPDPTMDYVLTDNGVRPIQEITCGEGEDQCRARLEENGEAFPIFDDPDLEIEKVGDGSVLELY